MAGIFSVGGLITGLDTNTIISQLVSIEQKPITTAQNRIQTLEKQRDALNELRTQLLSLRNLAQDFRINGVFSQYAALSTEEEVLSVEIGTSTPVSGSYEVNVLQLATATTARSSGSLGSPISTADPLESSGISTDITAGQFSVNGIAFSVDPVTQSLDDVLTIINASAAGVVATYDPSTDRVTFENAALNDTSIINFGASGDDSNFLTALGVVDATQITGPNGSTTATSTRNLGAVDPNLVLDQVSFAGGAITSGTFYINGVAITVDPSTDTLGSVLSQITASDAGVTASYDASTDSIYLASTTLGTRTIRFTSGTSNFLDVANLSAATQTAGNDAQFTVNGGPVITRNTNAITDAIDGVTLNLASQGTSTVSVSIDEDAIVADVQAFIEALNESVGRLRELTGQDGVLENDGSLRIIQNFLQTALFNTVDGLTGDYANLSSLGVSTGASFDASAGLTFELDEEVFRAALAADREAVQAVFANDTGTGIADQYFDYLDEITATTGFLNARARTNGTIDQQIQSHQDRIDRLEQRVAQYEERLRQQFMRLEQLSAQFQSQETALSNLAVHYLGF